MEPPRIKSQDVEFEEAHGVGMLPGLTGMFDGGVDEEDALGDILNWAPDCRLKIEDAWKAFPGIFNPGPDSS